MRKPSVKRSLVRLKGMEIFSVFDLTKNLKLDLSFLLIYVANQ